MVEKRGRKEGVGMGYECGFYRKREIDGRKGIRRVLKIAKLTNEDCRPPKKVAMQRRLPGTMAGC